MKIKKGNMNITKQIINHHLEKGYTPDAKGYLNTNEENLLQKFPNWDKIQKELSNGDGSELEKKFKAVHSSSALCVNNFAMIKLQKSNVTLFGVSGFNEAEFEKKFPTFLGKPANLDFYLENDNFRIGIESKFIEPCTSSIAKKSKNLEKYLNHKKLPEKLQKCFNEVIDYYINYKEKMHLDAAQLIKHSIALSLSAIENKGKKTKLIYLYWLPTNYKDIDIYQEHEKELLIFKGKIKSCRIPFESYTYMDLWGMMEKNPSLSAILKKIKARYEFSIKN
jgi:hypothetical protein